MLRKLRSILAAKPGCQSGAVVTVEKIRHVFQYGTRRNWSGMSLTEGQAQGLGRHIAWQVEARDWTIKVEAKGFKLGDEIIVPPHIKWSANPVFAYVGIVGDAVEFRYGSDQDSAWFLCPQASLSDDIRKIEAIFQFWYERLGLPQSLEDDAHRPNFVELIVSSSSPIRGFRVLSLQYPNHIQPDLIPFTARELAACLSRDMAAEGFEPTRFAVSEVAQGTGDHADAYWFEFGPYEASADIRYALIVRETAGGGFMLLVQDTGVNYGPVITDLFKKIVGSNTRPNL
jgi:hypothetical protein